MIKYRRHSLESSWVRAAADDFLELARGFPSGRPARICLAGGSTPAPVYAAIAAAMDRMAAESADGLGVAGPLWTLFVGDERQNARSDAERNETMIRAAFEPVLESGLAELVAWRGDALDALDAMEDELASRVPKDETLFDLCYLGLGADGHTAGIFPGTRPPYEGRTLSSRSPAPPHRRLTLSLDALRSSAHTRFLVRSRGKERALARLVERDKTCPAWLAAGDSAVVFILG